MQKLNLKVNGNCYEVQVGDTSACPVEVVVNGTTYFVEVEGALAPPALVTTAAPRPISRSLQPAVSAPAPVPAAPAAAVAGGNGSGRDMRAPMPGIIHNIAVKPGDSVTPGQQIFALEAMKMKSAIRTTQAGVVASIEVVEGQRVAYGQVLLKFA
jgi:biotin carboxyl carrier protein